MTKKPSPRNKEWEKERRDRLNQTFTELSKLLPQYKADGPAPSKIEILQKSIAFIQELQKQIKDGPSSTDSVSDIVNQTEDGPKPSEAPKSTKTPSKPIEAIADEKKNKRGTIFKIKKNGRKTKISINSGLYGRLRRHVLKRWHENQRKLICRRISRVKRRLAAAKRLETVPVPLSGKAIEKTFDDINDLTPIGNDNDLFGSLQEPRIASNSASLSLSPTEAFLMSFPVVSGSSVSVGKVCEQADVVQLPVSEPMTILGNIFSPREEFPPCRMESNVMPVEPQQKFQSISENKVPAPSTAFEQHQKSIEGLGQFPTHLMSQPLFESRYDGTAPFTFTLTTATTTHSGTRAIGKGNDSSTLTTDTRTTNSWSYNVKKTNFVEAGSLSTVDQSLPDNDVVAPFTFSLTTKSESKRVTTTSKTAPSSSLFDGYPATSFNSFANSFLAPPPPPPVVSECNPFAPTSFSFQLTTLQSPCESTYTPSNMNINSGSVSMQNQKRPVHKANSIDVNNFGGGKVCETLQKREKPVSRKSPAQEKKTPRVLETTNKQHVNWMTESTRNYPGEDQCHGVNPNTNQYGNSYGSTDSSAVSHQRCAVASDIFFAHPPGDERFLWSQNEKHLRAPEFNVPQLLPPPPPQGPFTSVPVEANAKNVNIATDYLPPNGNHFSVSNLVAPNKKYSNQNAGSATVQNINWRPANGNWDMDCQKVNNSMAKTTSGSKSYTAEALIGSDQSYSTGELSTVSPSKAHKRPNVLSVQNCTVSNSIIGDVGNSEGIDFNYSSNLPPFGVRTESKPSQPQDSSNPFQFFPNDFIQPPPLFAPPLPLLTDPPLSGLSNGKSGYRENPKNPSMNKRKVHYTDTNASSFILPINEPVIHQNNFVDLPSSSNLFTAPQAPPPFLMNSEPFGYTDNCKISHPPPPIDFNKPTSSGPTNYSTNYLPNFNLSSICPEINNPIN